MKKTLFIFLVFFASFTVQAQLSNTKWKGQLHLENKIDVVFDFRKDTLEVTNTQDNSHIETMTYTIKNNVLSLQKTSGQSNCDAATIGKYKFEISNDTLSITLVSDACDDRYPVLDNSKWVKVQ